MKYVCDLCGWEYDEEQGTQKAASHLEQSGKMYRKILNVRCVLPEKISSPKNKEKLLYN